MYEFSLNSTFLNTQDKLIRNPIRLKKKSETKLHPSYIPATPPPSIWSQTEFCLMPN